MTIWPEEMREYRAKMNDRILAEDHLPIKRFFGLDTQAYQEGALDCKTKELIGLSVSVALRCNDCIFYHIDRLMELGAGKSEIIEALNISLIIGGSIVIPHLRFAFGAMDAIEAEKTRD